MVPFLLCLQIVAQAEPQKEVTIVDLLVVYTPAVRTAAGGSAAIQDQIRTAVTEANLVFLNSQVDARVRLVHSAEVQYTESGSVSNDLYRLRIPNDGLLDEVHQLRDQFGADLVCLIVDTGNDYWFYGLQGPSPTNPFSVTQRQFLTGNYFFPVVLSFNFGCQLERPYADSVGAFPYSYGYSFRTPDGTFGTVDSLQGARLPWFSNPRISFQNAPCGIEAGLPLAADNARTIAQTAPIVSAFRAPLGRTLPPSVSIGSPTGTTNSPFTINEDTDLTIQATALDSDGFVQRVDFYESRNGGAEQRFLGTATNALFTYIWTNVASGDYTFFCVATDDMGASSRSRDLAVSVLPTPPPNDDFHNATPLAGTNILVAGRTTSASVEPNEPDWGFDSGSDSVWYSWTAPDNGRVSLSIPDWSYGVVFGAATGQEIQDLAWVKHNLGGDGWYTRIDFEVFAGTNYNIIVTGFQVRRFTLELNFTPSPLVRISSPSPDSHFTAGRLVLISASTHPALSDPVMRVEFFADNVPIGEAANEPFTIAWNAETTPGAHYLTARASDSAGQSSISPPVRVLIGPTNDNFADAAVLTGPTILVQSRNDAATDEPGEPLHGGISNSGSVWWSWTAPTSGRVTCSVYFPYVWPVLAVYRGTTLTNLTPIASSFTYSAFPSLSFEADANAQYFIVLAGGTGAFDLQLQFTERPANDLFENALALFGPAMMVTNSTTLAGHEAGEPVHAGNPGGHSTWWNWTAESSVPVEFSITASGFTPLLAIYTGDQITNLVPIQSGVNCPLTLRPVIGRTYRLAVDGADGGAGEYFLKLTTGPPNDDFTNAIPLEGLNVDWRGTNVAASSEPGERLADGPRAGKSVWWSWAAPAKGSVQLNVLASTFDVRFAVYSGSALSNLVLVTSNALPFQAAAGRTYWIAVDSADHGCATSSGEVALNLTETSTPSNDDFENRIALTGTNITFTATTAAATAQAGDPSIEPGVGHTIWWTWTAPVTGQALITVLSDWGPGLTMLVGTFTGNSLPLLIRRDFRQNFDGGALSTFDAIAGTTYQIVVDAWYAPAAGFTFNLTMSPAPANDDFSNRILLSGSNVIATGSNVGATREPGEPLHRGLQGNDSIWWSWTAPGDGTARILAAADFPNVISDVYTGSRVDALTRQPPIDGANIFAVQSGRTYQIAVDGQRTIWSDSVGNVTLQIGYEPYPPNDNFANRQIIEGTHVTVTGSNRAATREPGEPLLETSGHSIWWSWTAPDAGSVTIAASSPEIHPVLRVYTGTSISNLAVVAEGHFVVNFSTEPEVTYHIWADGYFAGIGGSMSLDLLFSTLRITNPDPNTVFSGQTNILIAAQTTAVDGTFPLISFRADGAEIGAVTQPPYVFTWTNVPLGVHNLQAVLTNDSGTVRISTLVPITVAPTNDNFVNRQLLAGGSVQVSGSTLGATREPGEPVHAGAGEGNSVWYSWSPPSSGPWAIVLRSRFNRPLAVYTGTSVTNLSIVASNAHGVVQFPASVENVYQIAVDHLATSLPDFTLEITQPPANDSFANRIPLRPHPGTVVGSNFGGSFEPGEPSLGPASDFSVWWSWTPSFSGTFQLTNVADGFRALIAFYTGDTLSNLVRVATIGGFVTLQVTAGTTYQIAASGDWWEGWTPTFTFLTSVTNDDFARRSSLTANTAAVPGSTASATAEVGEPSHAGQPSNHSAWWTWLAPQNGEATVSVIANGWSPVLAVYTGDDVISLQPVAAAAASSLRFAATAGTAYAIALDGLAGAGGDFTLGLAFTPRPPNDDFANRIILTGTTVQTTARTTAATREAGEPNHGGRAEGHSVWWTWTAPEDGRLIITAESTAAMLAAYTGDSIDELSTIADAGTATLALNALAGTTYQIALDTGSAELASVAITLLLQHPPLNDDFTNSITLAGSSAPIRGNNINATPEPTEFLPTRADGKTLWWTWTAPTEGMVVIEITNPAVASEGSGAGPLIGVFTGNALTNLTLVASNTFIRRIPRFNLWLVLQRSSFPATAGTTYQISVDSLNGSAGEFELQFSFFAVPENDDFADRLPLAGTNILVPGGNFSATQEPEEPVHGQPGGASVWYAWTAPERGEVNAQLTTTFSPLIAIYTGNSLTNLSPVASGADSVRFFADAGVTYQIAIDGAAAAQGQFDLSLALFPPPPNDLFAAALPIVGTDITISGSTLHASVEAGEPKHPWSTTGESVWYVWRAPANGDVTLNILDGPGPAFPAAYVGSSVSNLMLVPQTLSGYTTIFYALAGQTYHFAVSEAYAILSDFALQLKCAPPPPRTDTHLSISGSGFGFQIVGELGQSFQVQTSTDLAHWETIAVETLLGSTLNFQDPNANHFNHRFYRVLPLESAFAPRRLEVATPQYQPDFGATIPVRGRAGQLFILQASDDLGTWTEIYRGWISGSSINSLDHDATNHRRRFYRAITAE